MATSYRDSLSELSFSFILEKNPYSLTHTRTEIPSFESTSVLYNTPTNNAPMQELVMQDHKQNIYKICFRCNKHPWLVKS